MENLIIAAGKGGSVASVNAGEVILGGPSIAETSSLKKRKFLAESITSYPADCWKQLKIQLEQKKFASDTGFHSAQFYLDVVDILSTMCFEMNNPSVVLNLGQVLPLLESKLNRFPDVRKTLMMSWVATISGSPDQRKLKKEDERRLIYEAALIVLVSFRPDIHAAAAIQPYNGIEDLLHAYPQFRNLDVEELVKLLHFSNFMKFALVIVPAKGNKSLLLDLVTRITEGKYVKYITGGGPTAKTRRRIEVYEHEGGVVAVTRPWRKKTMNAQGVPIKDGDDMDDMDDGEVPESSMGIVSGMLARTSSWGSNKIPKSGGGMVRSKSEPLMYTTSSSTSSNAQWMAEGSRMLGMVSMSGVVSGMGPSWASAASGGGGGGLGGGGGGGSDDMISLLAAAAHAVEDNAISHQPPSLTTPLTLPLSFPTTFSSSNANSSSSMPPLPLPLPLALPLPLPSFPFSSTAPPLSVVVTPDLSSLALDSPYPSPLPLPSSSTSSSSSSSTSSSSSSSSSSSIIRSVSASALVIPADERERDGLLSLLSLGNRSLSTHSDGSEEGSGALTAVDAILSRSISNSSSGSSSNSSVVGDRGEGVGGVGGVQSALNGVTLKNTSFPSEVTSTKKTVDFVQHSSHHAPFHHSGGNKTSSSFPVNLPSSSSSSPSLHPQVSGAATPTPVPTSSSTPTQTPTHAQSSRVSSSVAMDSSASFISNLIHSSKDTGRLTKMKPRPTPSRNISSSSSPPSAPSAQSVPIGAFSSSIPSSSQSLRLDQAVLLLSSGDPSDSHDNGNGNGNAESVLKHLIESTEVKSVVV